MEMSWREWIGGGVVELRGLAAVIVVCILIIIIIIILITIFIIITTIITCTRAGSMSGVSAM